MPRIAKEAPWFGRRKGSQTFYAFWYDRDARETKRLSLGTQSPDEAKARFALFLSEGHALVAPNPKGLTVSQALRSYWQDHCVPNCACRTRQHYAIEHLLAYFGDTILSEIDIPLSRAYAEKRREAGAADSTIRRELSTLVAASNHARRWKRIAPDQMPSIELTPNKLLSQDDQAPFFTKAQVRSMIEAAEGEFRWFLELLYWTGARRESLTELEWPQVLWDQKQILLHKPGRRATKKRRPIVPLLPEMESAFKQLKLKNGTGERVFALDGQTIYRRFKSLSAKLGFPGHPHMFRHSRATHLLQDGVSLYAVARLLGDTMATVERVYGHHSAESLANHLGENSLGTGLAV
jgi:integrase